MAGRLRSQPQGLSNLPLREYARETLRRRLGRVAFEFRHARHSLTEERIHDLRVAIRRLTAAMRIFADVVPKGEARRVKSDLRKIMEPAGVVRELDIALELAEKSGIEAGSPLLDILRAQRAEGERRLLEGIRAAWRGNASMHWRERLQLKP
ncbi:MAG: CHAD domain-containing protein [Acidobacteriota bacterium]